MGIANASMGKGELIHREQDADIFTIQCDENPPEPIPLTLIMALPRPKVFRRILQSITSIGIKNIIFIHTFRVEKSYWQSPFLRESTIMEQCALGLQQAKDTLFPKIEMYPRFKPFAEDILPSLLQDKKGYIAHPYTEKRLPMNPISPAILAVGPEGGFIPFEILMMEQAGMEIFSIGKRILRVETALPILISRFIPR